MNNSKTQFTINREGPRSTFSINEKFPNLDPILLPEFGIKIYSLCNIFPTAQIGANCQIGAYTEIGSNVWIGNNVRIGAMCFIPEGVTIEDGAWIGPRCTFSNDMYPPSTRDEWRPTLIKHGARLGAGVCIRPGVTIGEGALIGMGAVVTKDVPAGETWAGVPAERIKSKSEG